MVCDIEVARGEEAGDGGGKKIRLLRMSKSF